MIGWLALALAVLILGAAARELWTVLRARAPREVKQVVLGAQGGPAAEIPRVIWTYWHATPPSDFVAQCLANWRRFAPDYEVRLLDPAAIGRWIPAADLPEGFDALPAYRQADWLRIQLLARHGGIWMDASTLMSRDLGWLHDMQRASRAEYAGFYIERYTARETQPIMENWFMAAIPGSRFARDLAERFDHALRLGAEAYLEELRAAGRLERVVQDLTPAFQRYLLMHVAASDLLDRAPEAYRLALLRAEDSAFAFHARLRWRKRHLYARLALTPCPAHLPMLIKLRGGDRQVVERGLARGLLLRDSALARLLAPVAKGTPS